MEEHLDKTLNLIAVHKCHDVFSLLTLLSQLGEEASEDDNNPERATMGLLVIDSLSALLSPLLTKAHHQGYTIMATVAAMLRGLATTRKTAALYTNHTVSAGQDSLADDHGSNLKPALGTRWTAVPHRRIRLSKIPGTGLAQRLHRVRRLRQARQISHRIEQHPRRPDAVIPTRDQRPATNETSRIELAHANDENDRAMLVEIRTSTAFAADALQTTSSLRGKSIFRHIRARVKPRATARRGRTHLTRTITFDRTRRFARDDARASLRRRRPGARAHGSKMFAPPVDVESNDDE